MENVSLRGNSRSRKINRGQTTIVIWVKNNVRVLDLSNSNGEREKNTSRGGLNVTSLCVAQQEEKIKDD